MVLLLTTVLWPLTVFLQDHVDGADRIQLEIEHMYADYDQHMHAGKMYSVEPLMELEDAEEMINASGAYLRESQRWQDGAQPLDLSQISAHVTEQMYLIDRYIQAIWTIEEADRM